MTMPPTQTTKSATRTGRPTLVGARTLPTTLGSDPIASATFAVTGQASLDQLAQLYRQRQLAIALAVSRAVGALWRQHVDPARMADSWASIRDIVLTLVRQYFQASAADSASTYEQMRVLAELGHRSVRMADLPQRELERVIDSQGIGRFFQVLPTVADDLPQATQAADLSLQASSARLALKGGRQTMVQAVDKDPLATGWERTISPTACSFCSMLASRGAVYKNQRSADFRAHDHCNCTAIPVFDGQEASQQSQELAKQWQQVTRGKSGANARKAWQQHWERQTDGGRDQGTTAEAQGSGTGDDQRFGRSQLPDQGANGTG